jgi:hypothetical protein
LIGETFNKWITDTWIRKQIDLSTFEDQGSDLYNILAWHAIVFPKLQNEQSMDQETIRKFRHTTALKSDKTGVYTATVDTPEAKGISIRWPARSGQEAMEELKERGLENITFVGPPMTAGDMGMEEGTIEKMLAEKDRESGDWWKEGGEPPEWA